MFMLISTFVIVPALLIGVASVLPFADEVMMAIVVLALCGGAPFVPWIVSLAKGNLPYSVAASTMLLVATIIVLPLAMPPLLKALDTGANVSVWHVAWPMLLLFILLPFAIGIVIRARSLSLTMALGAWLSPLSITFLLVHVVLYVSFAWDSFEEIAGYGQMAYTLAFPIVGLVVGYLLSPPYILSPIPRRTNSAARRLSRWPGLPCRTRAPSSVARSSRLAATRSPGPCCCSARSSRSSSCSP